MATDIQTLFHNPEILSDSDIKKVQWKMKQVKMMPWLFAGIGGGATFALDTMYLNRALCFKRIGVFAFAGFCFGLMNQYSVGTRKGNFETDPEII